MIHGLQLPSLWIIPTAAVSEHVCWSAGDQVMLYLVELVKLTDVNNDAKVSSSELEVPCNSCNHPCRESLLQL